MERFLFYEPWICQLLKDEKKLRKKLPTHILETSLVATQFLQRVCKAISVGQLWMKSTCLVQIPVFNGYVYLSSVWLGVDLRVIKVIKTTVMRNNGYEHNLEIWSCTNRMFHILQEAGA